MSNAEQLLAKDPASQMLGISLAEVSEGRALLRMLVTASMTNGYDICHGGFIYTLADTSSAFASSVQDETILSSSNQIEYLAPARLGDELLAIAEVRFTSGRNIYCDVQVGDQADRVIALMRSKLIRKA